jgi:hypothetical protein
MKRLIVLLMLSGILNIPLNSYSQCKGFVKKTCMPKLAPFIFNGQMNTTTLLAGDNAEVGLTFYAGQTYRVIICAQEVLGTLRFKLKDASGKVLFDNAAHDDTDFWDFKAETTQNLVVEVTVPKSDATNKIIPSGCVSVLVGFKQSDGTGPKTENKTEDKKK